MGAVSATTCSLSCLAGSLACWRRKLPTAWESAAAPGPKNTRWNSSAPARAIVFSAKSRSTSAMSMPVWNTNAPFASWYITTFISSRRSASMALASWAGCSGRRARAATAPQTTHS